MPLVMNASSQEQTVKVYGAWFTFKPKQIKPMMEDKAAFITSRCAYLGFVSLPDELEDLEFKNSAEGKRIIAAAEEQGIAHRVEHLEKLKYNETVALQRDIDQKNLKYSAALEIDPAALENLKELATYKTRGEDAAQKRADELKKITEMLDK